MTSTSRVRPLPGTLLRAALLAAHLALGVLLALALCVGGGRQWYRTRHGRRVLAVWMGTLNRLLRMRVRVSGAPCDGPVLLVANHVSWLDIPALAAVTPAVFVAKAEVRQWPLIGWLSARAGTSFLQRASLMGVRGVIDRLAQELDRGVRCAIFPEGTTTCGDDVAPFRAALYRPAGNGHRVVQAVAIRYCRDGCRDAIAPFVGDEAFLPHLWRVLRHGGFEVRLHFCAPATAAADRRVLAEATRAAIRQRLCGASASTKVA